jgi:hypothetical protein
MRNKAKAVFLGTALALSMSAVSVQADVVSDQAAAILIWPDVKFSSGDLVDEVDTILQVTNISSEPILLHCFYENANSHCSNNNQVCVEPSDCCDSVSGCGICESGWLETDFRIRLTPRQPLGWNASSGLSKLPLDGASGNTGIGGASNAGTRIPPVAEDPYTGALKCISINDDGTPTDRNVVKGEATAVYPDGDVSKHNAVGILALEGAVNDDNVLVLGGGEAEYNGCSNYLIVNHLFDLGVHPILEDTDITTISNIVLVPCTQDLLRQIPGKAVVQFLVYNEFEQRFSTSKTADCKADWRLSEIDTTDPERSIFSAGVAGTLVGQSRLNPVDRENSSGFVGIANETIQDDGVAITRSSFNINLQGDRAFSDIITLP